MNDSIIKVEGLGKSYMISHEKAGGYTALRDVITNKAKNLVKYKQQEIPAREEFWALKDIDFDIKKGEAVGIIGRNGAGKSTLLKILSRITEPTKGRIELNGRVASLLEVGTGFHPELTGRENIFLNGAILGMSRAEIRKKFDEIVDFSGVERFLDTPVKRYSSGMYVRLAFAVAAHLEPEILVVDEVLAVGDAEFQKKCLGKMRDVSEGEGRTVLFVSHNMPAVKTLCKKGLVLDKGTAVFNGDIDNAVNLYLSGAALQAAAWEASVNKKTEAFFYQVLTTLSGKQPFMELMVTTIIKVNEPFPASFMAFYIRSIESVPLMESIPIYGPFIESKEGVSEITIRTKIALPPMVPGTYSLGVWMGSNHFHTLDFPKDIVTFEITENPTPERTIGYPTHAGFIAPISTIEEIVYK